MNTNNNYTYAMHICTQIVSCTEIIQPILKQNIQWVLLSNQARQYTPITQKAETSKLIIPDQLQLYSKTLSQKAGGGSGTTHDTGHTQLLPCYKTFLNYPEDEIQILQPHEACLPAQSCLLRNYRPRGASLIPCPLAPQMVTDHLRAPGDAE